jgi:hypothetical protein
MAVTVGLTAAVARAVTPARVPDRYYQARRELTASTKRSMGTRSGAVESR